MQPEVRTLSSLPDILLQPNDQLRGECTAAKSNKYRSSFSLYVLHIGESKICHKPQDPQQFNAFINATNTYLYTLMPPAQTTQHSNRKSHKSSFSKQQDKSRKKTL
ncbi:hypothetical protein TgHK011_008885 [Trichoderma gracile]|nr:hypothetical protein TgHK011_008885 [Trichoderma gracile]